MVALARSAINGVADVVGVTPDTEIPQVPVLPRPLAILDEAGSRAATMV